MKEDSVPVDYKRLEKNTKFYTDREGVKHAEIFWTVKGDYFGYFPRTFKFEVEVIR